MISQRTIEQTENEATFVLRICLSRDFPILWYALEFRQYIGGSEYSEEM